MWQLLTQPWGKHSQGLVLRRALQPPSPIPIPSGWVGAAGAGGLFKPFSPQGRPTLDWEPLAGELRTLGQEDPSLPQGWTVGHLVTLCKPEPQMHTEELLRPRESPAFWAPPQGSVARSPPRPREAPSPMPAWTKEETPPPRGKTSPQLRQNSTLQSPGLTCWKTPFSTTQEQRHPTLPGGRAEHLPSLGAPSHPDSDGMGPLAP